MHNQAISILSAWQSIEVLTPQTYKKSGDYATSPYDKIIPLNVDNTGPLPWDEYQPSLPQGKSYCYQLVFGNLKLAKIYDKLIYSFADTKPVDSSAGSKAAIAVISIDANGFMGPLDQIAISSFAWAYPLVLKHQFDNIANWAQYQLELQTALHKYLHNVDVTDQSDNFAYLADIPKALTKSTIKRAYQLLLQKLELDKDEYEPFYFFVQKIVSDKPDDFSTLPLLNSFYIDELGESITHAAHHKIGAALQLYLQTKKNSEFTDVLTDKVYLENLMAPCHMPLGRWPSPGGHSLILLQQAIVNAVCHKHEPQDLLAINGPPGTGKTTIIRDIIADLIVKRARAMIEFDDPETAFTGKQNIRVFKDTRTFFKLDSKLTGFEILITSSGNNAVENISKELANSDAIATGMSSLDYFTATSNAIDAAHNKSQGHEYHQIQLNDAVDDAVESKTWGLIAAVLGNKGNKYKFRNCFWGSDDTSVKNYLQTAMGYVIEPTTQQINAHHSNSNMTVKWDPPQNKAEALVQWKCATQVFKDTLYKVQQQLGILENARQILTQIDDLRRQYQEFSQSVADAGDNMAQIISTQVKVQQAVDQYTLKAAAATIQLYKQKIDQPPFWHRFIKRVQWQQWHVKFTELKQVDQQICDQLAEFQNQHQALVSELSTLQAAADKAPHTLASYEEQIANCTYDIDNARAIAGDQFTDKILWAREHQALHKSTLWLSAEVQRGRDHIFTAAMAVHKAFIGAAAAPLYSNFDILMGLLGNCRSIQLDPEDLADVWRNLFLITPIVSTTFASVKQMFRDLPSESLGWLIVDEAGQSSPQAVVGAIRRCRRAVILGDPKQLEPVCELPDKLLDAICQVYNIDPEKWSPAYTSAQSCADAASKLGTYRGHTNNQVWVGLPLLVHRRCAQPMFGISNHIAYDNVMVHAAADRPSPIQKIIGPSCWIDVIGHSDDKWSLDEGNCVINIMRAILASGNDKPDIYILSPFKNVVYQMRELFKASISGPERFTRSTEQWFLKRIGTVHTFQGKEAEAVILILGASAPDESRARDWAGQSPNLLNVAVTRAKSVLYVVGNHQAWYQKGAFQTLATHLPLYDEQTVSV